MSSPAQESQSQANVVSDLLRQWRIQRVKLVFPFLPHLASRAMRLASRAIKILSGCASEKKSSLSLKRIISGGSRRIYRYLRLTAWTTDYLSYQYSLYRSLSAIRWAHKLPRTAQAAMLSRLEESGSDVDAVRITLVGASRKLGNPNHRLITFCQSVVNTTSDLRRIELVVRIDDDDDLLHYLEIKERFSPHLSIQFVVGSRKAGYKGLHTLVSDCLPYVAVKSELVFGFADDCRMIRQGWDNDILALSRKYPDNIVFINSLRDLELPYDEDQVFFWLLWCLGPPSLFTAVGRKALEITAKVAQEFPGWTAYGNSVMCDSFFESLQYYMWLETGERRAPVAAKTITMRQDILVPAHKEGGLMSQSPVAFNSYRAFLADETQAVIKQMALAIVREMQTAQGEQSSDAAGVAGSLRP